MLQFQFLSLGQCFSFKIFLIHLSLIASTIIKSSRLHPSPGIVDLDQVHHTVEGFGSKMSDNAKSLMTLLEAFQQVIHDFALFFFLENHVIFADPFGFVDIRNHFIFVNSFVFVVLGNHVIYADSFCFVVLGNQVTFADPLGIVVDKLLLKLVVERSCLLLEVYCFKRLCFNHLFCEFYVSQSVMVRIMHGLLLLSVNAGF